MPDTHPLADIDLFFERLHYILGSVTNEKNSRYEIVGDFNLNVLISDNKTTEMLQFWKHICQRKKSMNLLR